MLLEHGADVDAASHTGETALGQSVGLHCYTQYTLCDRPRLVS